MQQQQQQQQFRPLPHNFHRETFEAYVANKLARVPAVTATRVDVNILAATIRRLLMQVKLDLVDMREWTMRYGERQTEQDIRARLAPYKSALAEGITENAIVALVNDFIAKSL